jgi:hypothetical protein
MGISIPIGRASDEHFTSTTITQQLLSLIINEQRNYDANIEVKQKVAKSKAHPQQKARLEQETTDARIKVPQHLQRYIIIAQEKGASLWLGVTPLAEYDLALHKGNFKDAQFIRYNWTLLHSVLVS